MRCRYTRPAVVGRRPVCAGRVRPMALQAQDLLELRVVELVDDAAVAGAGEEVSSVAGDAERAAPRRPGMVLEGREERVLETVFEEPLARLVQAPTAEPAGGGQRVDRRLVATEGQAQRRGPVADGPRAEALLAAEVKDPKLAVRPGADAHLRVVIEDAARAHGLDRGRLQQVELRGHRLEVVKAQNAGPGHDAVGPAGPAADAADIAVHGDLLDRPPLIPVAEPDHAAPRPIQKVPLGVGHPGQRAHRALGDERGQGLRRRGGRPDLDDPVGVARGDDVARAGELAVRDLGAVLQIFLLAK